MLSVLNYEIKKRNITLGKHVRAWYIQQKQSQSYVIEGVVVYIHPEGRYVVLNTGHYNIAFHPFAIELPDGSFIDALYTPEEERNEDLIQLLEEEMF